jgi:hypothetical protein
LLDGAADAYWRGVSVNAAPAFIFRWLCQLKVAPYSYDWIDNWGRKSPRALTPGLDDLEIGQKALLFFRVAAFERDRSLTIHAPKSKFGNVAVSYVVTPIDDERSRLTAKVIVRYPGVTRVMRHVPPVGDLVMMRKQLRTLKECAERDVSR